jgi:succinate dehydrogenase / fumarate reductase cytochrome b subunit
VKDDSSASFLARNEFLLRRLHSLSGVVPVGAYMCVHLLTNASVNDSPTTFQKNVYLIHSLGAALPIVEWVFIFLPLLFHAIYGVLIVRGCLPNYSSYKTQSNLRYTLQRATGMIAFLFIVVHVFHMHGWFHFDWWLKGVAEPLGGAQFKPYNATSTAAAALSGLPYQIFYLVGILSCVFHLANGIWTFGITWGLWISPAAQTRASYACLAFGLALSLVSLGALGGFATMGKEAREKAEQRENEMYKERVAIGDLDDSPLNQHKRKHASHKSGEHAQAPAAAESPVGETDKPADKQSE